MTIIELFDLLLVDNVDMELIGSISCDDETIMWEYDGLGKTDEDMETHLTDIFDMDKETLSDYFIEMNTVEAFFFQEPEIADSFITFHISED